MKMFLNPDSEVKHKVGAYAVTMKPVSKQKMLAFFVDNPGYMKASLLGQNAIKELANDKKDGFDEFLELIVGTITEWTFEEEATKDNLYKMNPIFLFLIIGAFNRTNFLGSDERNFTEQTPEA